MATAGRPLTTLDLRPSASVYATYRRLSYKPWYAIAEFVDNSTQSYFDHRDELRQVYATGKPDRLVVEVTYDSAKNTLTVADNAYGMNLEELKRAVILDSPPPNRTGRCEFGMGLKTAACWFGGTWNIRTTRLGEHSEFEVTVHVPDLAAKRNESVTILERPAEPQAHYTVLTISDLYKPIRGRTPERIRKQLGSMYREDLRSGEIEILWNSVPVTFQEHPILEEEVDGEIIRWRKDVYFEVEDPVTNAILPVRGWVGVRVPASQQDAGFALLRRGRVIIGGPGENYKPVEIFGQGNTFRSQRLVGELHLDNWPVTQAKDAFDWSGGLEDVFIDKLRAECLEYMNKAEGYRERSRPITKSDLELASEAVERLFADSRFASAIERELSLPEPPKTDEQIEHDVEILQQVSVGPVHCRLKLGADTWVFKIHWQDRLTDAPWMEVQYPQDHEIHVFLNMAHPFIAKYVDNPVVREFLQKFVSVLALAEKMARQASRSSHVAPEDIRMYINRVFRLASELEVHNAL